MYLSVGQAAKSIGVSISTMRRWEEEGFLVPCYRTRGGHRRYSVERLEKEVLKKHSDNSERKAVAYARVSSHDQKGDLERCEENIINYDVISDLGSGINYNKKGLKKLINLICSKKVSKLEAHDYLDYVNFLAQK